MNPCTGRQAVLNYIRKVLYQGKRSYIAQGQTPKPCHGLMNQLIGERD